MGHFNHAMFVVLADVLSVDSHGIIDMRQFPIAIQSDHVRALNYYNIIVILARAEQACGESNGDGDLQEWNEVRNSGLGLGLGLAIGLGLGLGLV